MPGANFDIAPVSKSTIDKVISMIMTVFERDVAPTLPPEGAETFAATSPQEQRKGLAEGQIFFVATVKGTPAGAVRISDEGHLFLLFVDGNYQGQGLGRLLLQKGLRELRRRRPDLPSITLNSSLNAVDVYQHWGCERAGEQIEKRGVRAVPMTLDIDAFLAGSSGSGPQ